MWVILWSDHFFSSSDFCGDGGNLRNVPHNECDSLGVEVNAYRQCDVSVRNEIYSLYIFAK